MQRRFLILDVFTDAPMSGNQLAVVFDVEGLSGDAMQAIAREFGFSETTFISAADNPVHSAKVRIFTPANELPFAGHPTVGTAIAIAMEGEHPLDETGQGLIVLEEGVGPVRCGVMLGDGASYAQFDLPRVSKRLVPAGTKEDVAAALSLDVADIGFENHVHANFDGGVPYDLVPVKDLAAAARAKPDMTHWRKAFGTHDHNCAFVYCRETLGHDNQFHARMFAPDSGIDEDPATGSAVAAFAGAVALFDKLPDGWHEMRVEQGIEMGRPSQISLEIEMAGKKMVGGRIGGHAVIFAQGTLEA